MQNGIRKMRKIRVAFFLNLSEEWLGGVNYFKNLLHVITGNQSLNVEPVIFISRKANRELLNRFPKIDIIESDVFKRGTLLWLFNKLSNKIFHYDYYLEYLLSKYNIDIVSHVSGRLCLSQIPQIAWIPDFQHKYFPDFFSEIDLKNRDKIFMELAKFCECVILSSDDAKKDFISLYPKYACKAKVLQFVVPFKRFAYIKEELLEKYQIKDGFLYIPNQFWKHKNHKVVLQALKILKDNGRKDIQVVCSGNTEDYRNVEYFKEITNYIKDNNLQEQFIVLGRIPYRDVQTLMMECKALINPSLFEGWNTMVEEAKSLGKRIILSDLPVHKEQNPPGGIYFDRNNPENLAQAISWVLNENNDTDSSLINNAEDQLVRRKKIMSNKYRDILEFVIKNE